MMIHVLLSQLLRSRPAQRLDDSPDGRDALFAVQWGGSMSLAVIEFDCWSLYSDIMAVHRIYHQRARRLLYLPAALAVTTVAGIASGRADLSLLRWSASTLLAIVVVGLVLQNYAAARSRRRWEQNPLLSCIEALGGFAGLPVIWGRNIPAVVRMEGTAEHTIKTGELASAYRKWVRELAGVHTEEALTLIEALSDQYHGTLGELRATATELV